MDPRDKVALVTGGAVRMGRALTLGLAGAGAHVLVHYHRSAAAAEETVVEARALGVRVEAVQADLADPVDVERLVQAAHERFGRVDILVHSASPFVRASLADVTLDTWRQVMGVVVEGFLLLVQGLAAAMVERGQGAIVAVLDRGIFDPWPAFLAHGVAKSALWALARNLAVELAPCVRVNGVVPGPVLPPPGLPAGQIQRLARGTLLGRWGAPQDVVDAALFLIRSDYITGEALFVDGGERYAHRQRSSRLPAA